MPRRPRVFLDANVLFSAAILPRGNVPTLLALGRVGACALLTSGHALEEARRNLGRKMPRALAQLPLIEATVELVPEPDAGLLTWAGALGLPEKETPILAAANRARADLLVTGDRRHFGPLFGRTFDGVRVLPLADGLAAVLAAAEDGAAAGP